VAIKQHLVARCPCCERPIWQKNLVALLGLTPFAKRFPHVGFVAVTRGAGQGRGWKPGATLQSLAEVANLAGPVAVEQLRKLARQAFQRMWLQGLLTPQDVAEVMAIRSLERPEGAPARTIDRQAFDLSVMFPNREVAATTHQAPALWSAPAPAPASPSPPARAVSKEAFRL